MSEPALEDIPEIAGGPRASLSAFAPTVAEYDAASDWLLRLRERDLETSREFEQWKLASPTHEYAFAEVEALFALSARPAQEAEYFYDSRERPRRWPSRRWRWASMVIAASLALLLALPFAPNLGYLGADAATATGELRTVRLADGSRVTLNTASAIDADVTGGTTRKVTLRGGEAYFEVVHDPARPFLVHAGNADVRVLGTKFNIRIDADQSRIAVTQGHVRVALATNPKRTVDLLVGQEALADRAGLQKQGADTYEATAWRHHQLLFSYVPLRLVVRDLNRYRRAPIYIANGALADNLVSGVFRTDDPDGALRIMERTMGIDSVTLPTGQTILY
ncbi:MAG: FecR domain-containing protein [Candidatus Andeanibacterium colombiense]|uniref:FecR domain-containing protein n=1 Tax=Candidatus Andeanibacterium colombiense TaxID=3121345 RepID=A0AAJ5X3B5_9SPHN|nr:MAG: FecR domain-containing protein [Sphingomonadaceae bacterium]